MDLVTIVINVYNGEKYLKKCLDSIVNQTYKNLDILIINDGSTDNSLDIIKSYQDKRIRIITTENLGLSLSRNKGIDNALGQYIYFVDVDDFIDLDTIEYLYNLSKKYAADITSCKPLDIYNYNFKVEKQEEKIEVLDNIEFLKRILLNLNRSGACWNKLFKKSVFNDIRFENRIINDIAIMYKIALRTDKYVYSNLVKYYYLKRKNSITGIHKSDRAIDQYKVAIERYNYINNIFPDLDENKVSLLYSIVMVYNHNNKDVDDFLKEEKAKRLFNSIYSFKKVIKSKLDKKNKIKIILYKISPKFERTIQKIVKEK